MVVAVQGFRVYGRIIEGGILTLAGLAHGISVHPVSGFTETVQIVVVMLELYWGNMRIMEKKVQTTMMGYIDPQYIPDYTVFSMLFSIIPIIPLNPKPENL